MIEETETSHQKFERVKNQIEDVRQQSEEILGLHAKQPVEDLSKNKQEIEHLKTDSSIIPSVEKDINELKEAFLDDPALEKFLQKFQVKYSRKKILIKAIGTS